MLSQVTVNLVIMSGSFSKSVLTDFWNGTKKRVVTGNLQPFKTTGEFVYFSID